MHLKGDKHGNISERKDYVLISVSKGHIFTLHRVHVMQARLEPQAAKKRF